MTAPKPTRLRIVQGNPGKRPLNLQEPVLPAAVPEPPEDMSEGAAKEWRKIAPILLDCGLITNADGSMLAVYCEAWARMCEAMRHMRTEGTVIKTRNGYPIQSPWYAVLKETQSTVLRFGTEFGLSPASRSRVKVDNNKKLDEFDAFLASRKR